MYEKKGNSHHNEKKGNSHDHYKCYIRNRFLVSQDPDGGMECEDMEMRSVFRLRDHDSIADGVVVIEDGEVPKRTHSKVCQNMKAVILIKRMWN